MAEDLQEYLRFARETAYQAGRLTLEYFNKGVQADAKADGSPVTIADRQAEQVVRRAVEQRYPTHYLQDVLDRVPPEAQGVACVCRACATGWPNSADLARRIEALTRR